MIVDHEALLVIAAAIQTCAKTATDERGVKIHVDVSKEDAYRAALAAMVSVQPSHGVPYVLPRNSVIVAGDTAFPPCSCKPI